MEHAPEQDFRAVKQRLEVIAEAVESPDMPLDEVLGLFEEAVALGLKVGDMLEIGTDEADEITDEAHIGEDI